jgi:hypothetical protein
VLVEIFALAIFASDRSKQSTCRYTFAPQNQPKFDPDQIFTFDRLWPPQVSDARVFEVRLTNLWAASMNTSARMILELNIKHYQELLKTEADASKRQVISKLLSEEKDQLAKLLARKDMDK